ncbi:MAG: hypothetical protein K2L41_09665, partial [Muribaculaceae bacterium]|nr:hypothetical protein [Muribaculaceae bacterium]
LWGLLAAVVLFINLVPVVIRILYSDDFLPAVDYVTVASVGTIFKAVSFVMAYVILARGDGVVFLVTESLSAVFYLVLSVIGFQGGMTMLGVAYVVWYAVYAVIVLVVCCCRYRVGGLGKPLLYSLSVIMIVATQATLCHFGFYLVATIMSGVIVPIALTMLYLLFLKRRTLKE